MDPNGIYEEGPIDKPERFPDELPPGVQRTGNYYAYRRTYNDGRVVTQWFKRGTATEPGGPDRVIAEVPSTNTGVKEDWDKKKEEQEKKTETETTRAERKVTRVYVGTDPGTGRPAEVTEYEEGAPTYKEIRPAGAASTPEAAEREAQKAAERRRNAADPAIRAPIDDVEKLQLEEARRKEREATDERARQAARQEQADILARGREERAERAEERAEAEKARKEAASPGTPTGNRRTVKDPKTGTETTLIEVVLPDGSKVERKQETQGAPEKQEIRDLEGVPHRVIRDERGNVTGYEPIPITRKPLPPGVGDWQPDITKKAAGLIERAAEIRKWRAEGLIDDTQARELLAEAQASAKALLDQAQGIVGAQRDVAGLRSGERAQDITASNQATSFAQSTFNQALSSTMDANQYVQPGSDVGGRAFLALLEIAQDYARRAGGLRQLPPTPLGPALQSVMEMDLPGLGTIRINPQGGATAAPAGGVAAPAAAPGAGPSWADAWAAPGGAGVTPPVPEAPPLGVPGRYGAGAGGPAMAQAMFPPGGAMGGGYDNDTLASSGAFDDDVLDELGIGGGVGAGYG